MTRRDVNGNPVHLPHSLPVCEVNSERAAREMIILFGSLTRDGSHRYVVEGFGGELDDLFLLREAMSDWAKKLSS